MSRGLHRFTSLYGCSGLQPPRIEGGSSGAHVRPAGGIRMARYSNGLVLPRRVAQFIEATNAGDLPRLLNVFAADAIVNDQLQQWCGAAELRKWAELDVI